jgi:hypothetical protein
VDKGVIKFHVAILKKPGKYRIFHP